MDRSDVIALRLQYPHAVLTNKTNTDHRIQEYDLVIPEGSCTEESYYEFLLDHLIATSSRKFQARYSHDHNFRERMKARADENLRRMKRSMTERQTTEKSQQ
ncbi:hypothetical protein [Geomonas sp.]|uniref:hypothetical protein n=1 Tax=Geomonas sp. TaxID=2651584 RepID=UPI002B49AE2C|nr:hypothetical protein [Geomonas sp.]